jgi:NAD-dependent SIR2 family protein deacetylase
MTSNVDGMFEKAGFDRSRIYTPQGDYARLQCVEACTEETWDSKPVIDRILPQIDRTTLTITDPSVVPYCPNCGGTMFLNVRVDSNFIDEPYMPQVDTVQKWLESNSQRKLCVIELGSGFNTPSVIRWPLENLVYQSADASLLRINQDHPQVPEEIAGKSLTFAMDAGKWIAKMTRILQGK